MKQTLITGANTGLGLASSKMLVRAGHHVILLCRNPEKGADTQVWLADSPEVAGKTGGYYAKRKPGKRSRQASDATLAEDLWKHSAALLGLDPEWP